MNNFLKEYLSEQSPSGAEIKGQQVWVKGMNQVDGDLRFDADNFGNVLATKAVYDSNKINIVIAAHSDEIGWRISHIEESGLIRVVRNGGSDTSVILGTRCDIMTMYHGKVRGIFGQRAVHLRKHWTEETKEPHELYIDIGAESIEDVHQKGIQVGDIVCGYDEPMMLSENKITSRALDNKIGGHILVEVAKRIKDKDFKNVNVTFVNTIQEETGLRGAKMVAEQINPDIVFVTDVCHATDTPDINHAKVGDIKLGFGGAICRGSLLNEKLVELATTSSKKYQLLATKEGSGTDADSFALANGGTPTCLIKTPLRYMHTQVETCDLRDADNIAETFAEMICNIEKYHEEYKNLVDGVGNKNEITKLI